jgi:hypothetical protein
LLAPIVEVSNYGTPSVSLTVRHSALLVDLDPVLDLLFCAKLLIISANQGKRANKWGWMPEKEAEYGGRTTNAERGSSQ